MYTLIGHPKSRAFRVLWALEELELAYDYKPNPPRDPEVVKLNPTGKIPVLLTDEGPITDSVAIMTFLADRHGGLTHPAGSYARAVQDAATNFVTVEIDAALWTYGKHSFVLPEHLRVPAAKDTAKWEFAKAISEVAAMWGEGPYLAGDRFTIADILMSHCAGWALGRGFELPGGAFGDYLKSVTKRPGHARAMKAGAAA